VVVELGVCAVAVDAARAATMADVVKKLGDFMVGHQQ